MSSASSPAAAVAAEVPRAEPPSDEERWRRLAALRSELDRVDDALHDGLMRRAELVEQVRAVGAKGRVPLRPGREAAILRRLVERNRGALAPATLVRVWREVLAGSSAQQAAMRVMVGGAALLPAVREHFGAGVEAELAAPADAIASVREGRATLAAMPIPAGADDWWLALAREPAVHVVARLPFWRRPGGAEALVLGPAAPDPSGRDRSLLVGAPDFCARVGGTVLATAGGLALAELDGFMAADDARLNEAGATVLGAYAVPIGDDR